MVIAPVVVFLSLPAGRNLVRQFFRSLRMQKVQAVDVDLSSFTDPNANPALHQMIAKMVSDKVVVTVNEPDQPASDAAAASQLAGFPVHLLGARTDSPKLLAAGQHAMNLTVDRSRLATVGIISSLIMPSEAIWRRAAFEMESPLAGSLPFSPFADISVPSLAMIGYAGVYLLVALAIAIHNFQQRDL